MEKSISKRRLALAGAIVIVTTFSLQYRYNKHVKAQHPIVSTTAKTAIAGDSGSRDHEPGKPLIWFLGSTLLGLVGLKRFGLNRG